MQLERSQTTLSPIGSVHVTVTVQIQQDDSMYNFYDTERPATPLDPMLPPTPVNTQLVPPVALTLANVQGPSTTAFAEVALRTVENNEMRGIHTVFSAQEPPVGHTVIPVESAASLICSDVISLAIMGQELVDREKLEDHAMAIPTETMEIDAPAAYWMHRLELLKNVDPPTFHMLCDSLHAHTPHQILLRWNTLRNHMSQRGQVLADLLRLAEQLARHIWPPLVLELYFLLLE
jgi:hypothetical protein